MKQYLARKYESVGWSYLVNVIRKRCKKSGITCTITSSFIRQLYSKQEGLCALTG